MQISKTANQTAARRKKPRRFSFRHWWKKSRPLTFVLLCVIAAVMLIPIVFTFLYSFFPKSEISDYLNQRSSYDVSKWLPVLFSPSQVSLRQYYKILIEQPQYLKLFLNSVKYSVGILLGQAVIIPMTAYGLSRFRFNGRDALFFLVLVLMLLPFQVTMAPSVMTLRALGILNTPWAVILPMWFSPFYLFLVRQFMLGLPNELLEAGQMDGAGTFRLPVAGGAAGLPAHHRRVGGVELCRLLESGGAAAHLSDGFQPAAIERDVQPDQHRLHRRGVCGRSPVHPAHAAGVSVFPGRHPAGRAA